MKPPLTPAAWEPRFRKPCAKRFSGSISKMLKKPENRLPTRAAQKRGHVFACTCRAATVRERRPLPILPLLLAALCLVAGSAAGQGQAPEAAATQPPVGEWQSLFDGKSLAGWKETPFSGHGP